MRARDLDGDYPAGQTVHFGAVVADVEDRQGEFVADTFDYLKAQQTAGASFDTIVLDPPAFAKTRASIPAAIHGYKDINLRAMRLLSRNGVLFTASCSFHLSKSLFLEMLHDAAADSGRRISIRAITAQPLDHPEIVTITETGYLK